MKNFYITILLVFFSIAFAEKRDVLTVYTYDSFVSEEAPGAYIKQTFEEHCNCEIRFVTVNDGVSLLNRLKLEKNRTKADVILGLDNNLLADAINSELIQEIAFVPENLVINWHNEYAIPYDYGYLAFIYDQNKLTNLSNVNLPQTMDEFIHSDYTLIYPDPRISTPGFAFLLWIKKLYGSNSQAVWQKINQKSVTIAASWSDAYSLFLKGEADFVLSYDTSPIAHLLMDKNASYRALTFKDGHYLQIELASVSTFTKNKALSEKFIEFLLLPETQSIIATKNIMRPVIETHLPTEFMQIEEPIKALQISSDEINQSKKTWIKEWRSSGQ